MIILLCFFSNQVFYWVCEISVLSLYFIHFLNYVVFCILQNILWIFPTLSLCDKLTIKILPLHCILIVYILIISLSQVVKAISQIGEKWQKTIKSTFVLILHGFQTKFKCWDFIIQNMRNKNNIYIEVVNLP